MRVCKRLVAVTAACFTFFAAFSQGQNALPDGNASAGSGGLSMPEMPKMPSMPSLSASMQMPEINMPSAPAAPGNETHGNGNFYVPGFQNQNKNQAEAKNTESSKVSQPVSSEKADSKSQRLNSITKDLLSAGDISTLYDSGLFGSISSLTGGANLSAASNVAGEDSSLVLLQQILKELEELKAAQKNITPEQKLELAKHQSDAQVFKNREPKILRFKINGYNINDSVTKVFFSDTEADGTFMLTADRTYYVNRQTRTETFYILFKAIRSNGSAVTYDVRPSVVQDSENKNSFVYRFAEMKDLRAEKTGNLVALHSSNGDLNVDLLLDIDGEK